MTLVSGARSAGQRERCGQKNCKTPALSVVARMCRYVDVLHTHTCAVTECSFVCTFGSSHRVPETNCVIHSHHHCFPNNPWMVAKLKERYYQARQEDDQRKSIVQQVLRKSADFLKRIIVEGHGGGGGRGSRCRTCAVIVDDTTFGGSRRGTGRNSATGGARSAANSTTGKTRTSSWFCTGQSGPERGEGFLGSRATSGSVRES